MTNGSKEGFGDQGLLLVLATLVLSQAYQTCEELDHGVQKRGVGDGGFKVSYQYITFLDDPCTGRTSLHVEIKSNNVGRAC